MYIISTLYKIFLDALFPLSDAEQELFLLQPEQAYEKLPSAPGYEGLAVPLLNTRSVFAYKDERVAKLVWNIKYKKSALAVQIGGYALWQKLKAMGAEHVLVATLIIPMPITEKRRRERGYNQCELLVDEIGRLDKNDQFIIKKDLLIRVHHASRQTLKGREARVESSQGIFGISKEIYRDGSIESLKTLPLIVIDDVVTTGSTMYEAIETLKKAGFQDVRGLALAH